MPIPSPADFRDRTKTNAMMREMLAQVAANVEKTYPSLDAANADIANISVGQVIRILNTENNGEYYKSVGDATSLTKSAYDPKDNAIKESAKYTDLKTKDFVKAKPGSLSNLYEFNDADGNTVAAIKLNGDIVIPDVSLYEVSEKVNKSQEKLENQLGVNNTDALYTFNDADGNAVLEIKPNGDVITSEHSLNDVATTAKEVARRTDQQLEKTEDASLYKFEDIDGNTVVEVTSDGDILFDGNKSLKALIVEPQKTRKTVSLKESISDEFLLAFSQQGITQTGRSYYFNGLAKKKFSFNNSDFLSLRIEQSERRLLDTPYFKKDDALGSQVCHLYICDFNDALVHGYRYIVLATPFHNNNEDYENPCVWGSHDLQEFDLLSDFEQPLDKPWLDKRHHTDYLSDPFGFYNHLTGEFYCFYRHSFRETPTSGRLEYLYARKTLDFINWSDVIEVKDYLGEQLKPGYSPCILFNPALNKFVLYAVSTKPNGVLALRYRTSDSLESGWSAWQETNYETTNQFWHLEVKYCGDKFIAIVHDRESASASTTAQGQLFLGVSNDGIDWDFSEPIISGEFLPPYKASINPIFEDNTLSFQVLWSNQGDPLPAASKWHVYSTVTDKIEVI